MSSKKGVCGEHLEWTIDESTGHLEITGYGEMWGDWEWDCPNDQKWGGVDVKSVSLPEDLTSIGDHSFDDCRFLSSINIPDSVTTIGYWAFGDCISLRKIKLGKSVTQIAWAAFSGCIALDSVEMNDALSEIADEAFDGCISLRSVKLPGSLRSIGSLAFRGCRNLSEINIPESIISVDDYVFDKYYSLTEIRIPYSLDPEIIRSLSESVPQQDEMDPEGNPSEVCDDIEYRIPESVTSIEKELFDGFSCLTSIIIPKTVTNINYNAFNRCYHLESISVDEENPCYSSKDGVLFDKDGTLLVKIPAMKTGAVYAIPESVRTIGEYAIDDLRNIKTLIIPRTVDCIRVFNFRYCPSLERIDVDGDNPRFHSDDGILFSSGNIAGILELTQIVRYPPGRKDRAYSIPGTVDRICSESFTGCSHLEEIGIPSSVCNIDYRMFDSCTSLRSITMDGGNSWYCSEDGIMYDRKRGTLEIRPKRNGSPSYRCPDSLQNISNDAFSGDGLKEVVFVKGMTVLVWMGGFHNCTALERITIEEGATVAFWNDAIVFDDNEVHEIHVDAPEGYTIPECALDGKIRLIYG